MYKNKPRNTRIQSAFCWRSNPNNDKHNFLETTSENGCKNREKRPGDLVGVKNWTFFGLKKGQNLENRTEHSHQEFSFLPY